MAIWPFNREKTTTGVSSDTDDYYRTERRERVGLAWLLAFGSLIATLLIALALFYGIRFIYHKVHHTNTGNTTATTESTASNQGSATSNAQSSTGQTNASGSGTTSTPSTPGTSSSASTSGSSAHTSSSATSSGQNIANTGPGDTFAIFLAVSMIGALAHNAYQRRKLSE